MTALNPDGPHSPRRTAEAGQLFDDCSRFLIAEGVERPEIIVNILGFAAARLVADGKAWAEAGEEANRG